MFERAFAKFPINAVVELKKGHFARELSPTLMSQAGGFSGGFAPTTKPAGSILATNVHSRVGAAAVTPPLAAT